MAGKIRVFLLFSVVLLLAIAFLHHPVKASTGTSQGVTLIQLGCAADSNGSIYGPFTSTQYSGDNACSNGTGSIAMPLPSGTLYNMRAVVGAYSLNGSAENLKVSVFTSASRKAVMTCGVSVPRGVTCNDLTDTVSVNAGDRIWATVSLPDSNTLLQSVAISIEENIIE